MKFTHTSILFGKLEGERDLGQKHIINIGKHSRAHIHLYTVCCRKKSHHQQEYTNVSNPKS